MLELIWEFLDLWLGEGIDKLPEHLTTKSAKHGQGHTHMKIDMVTVREWKSLSSKRTAIWEEIEENGVPPLPAGEYGFFELSPNFMPPVADSLPFWREGTTFEKLHFRSASSPYIKGLEKVSVFEEFWMFPSSVSPLLPSEIHLPKARSYTFDKCDFRETIDAAIEDICDGIYHIAAPSYGFHNIFLDKCLLNSPLSGNFLKLAALNKNINLRIRGSSLPSRALDEMFLRLLRNRHKADFATRLRIQTTRSCYNDTQAFPYLPGNANVNFLLEVDREKGLGEDALYKRMNESLARSTEIMPPRVEWENSIRTWLKW